MRFYAFAKVLVGIFYAVLFRIRVEGKDNIPNEGGIILCANHISYHDTVVLGLISPRQLHFVAKEELWRIKLISKLFTKLGAIPINRQKPGIDTLKQVVNVLKDGRALAIFLQGGRKKDIDVDDAKAGVALFAIKGKAPVVPINISSSFRIFSKVDINIGKPITFEEYWDKKIRTQELNEIASKILREIKALGAK